ncbi:EamA family transporter [Thalassospira marina]|nr:EamA family transporter [Thalassospira marina]
MMSPVVFSAVLCSALLHAGWNSFVKGSARKDLATFSIVLAHVPVAIIGIMLSPTPDMASMGYLAAGSVLHVGYQLFLMRSYMHGDLSQIYPLARGLSPVLITIISLLFLNVSLNGIELSAIAIIATGIAMQARSAWKNQNAQSFLLAFATGCFIMGYSLVDGTGARIAGTALGFYSWLSILNAVLMVIYMAIFKPGLFRELRTVSPLNAAIGGAGSFCAYAIVIWACTQAPIALVSALRESSILFAILIARFVLKEEITRHRMLAVSLIATGVVLSRLGH